MLDAVTAASRFVEERTRSDLDADQMLVFALVRAVEVIGEAASKISSDGRAELPALPWGSTERTRGRDDATIHEVRVRRFVHRGERGWSPEQPALEFQVPA